MSVNQKVWRGSNQPSPAHLALLSPTHPRSQSLRQSVLQQYLTRVYSKSFRQRTWPTGSDKGVTRERPTRMSKRVSQESPGSCFDKRKDLQNFSLVPLMAKDSVRNLHSSLRLHVECMRLHVSVGLFFWADQLILILPRFIHILVNVLFPDDTQINAFFLMKIEAISFPTDSGRSQSQISNLICSIGSHWHSLPPTVGSVGRCWKSNKKSAPRSSSKLSSDTSFSQPSDWGSAIVACYNSLSLQCVQIIVFLCCEGWSQTALTFLHWDSRLPKTCWF